MSDYNDIRVIAQLEGYCETGDSGSLGGYWTITNHHIYFVKELEDTEATALITKEYIHSIQYESFLGDYTNVIFLTTGGTVNANFGKKKHSQFHEAMRELIPGISIEKTGSIPRPVFNAASGGYADSGALNIVAQIEGSHYKDGSNWPIYGSWTISDSSLFFTEDAQDAHPMIQIDNVNIHSIMSCDSTEYVYLYDGGKIEASFERANEKLFLSNMEQVIPGLLIVKVSFTGGEYDPGISELDPRNPYGTRYNPDYPRGGYVLASYKAFLKNMSSINPAVKAAQDAGILPADWNPVTDAFDEDHPLAGVPIIYDAW